MPKWTTEQQEAIDLDNTNIIVSAGAGSGKTAVLTERVIRKLRSGVHIDELLILTFTKAAAGEMKERIRKAINKDSKLYEELNRLDNAYITTFDSFSLSVVKKYHYLLNIDRFVSIIDSSVMYLKKKEVLDKIFLELYEEKEDKFLKLIMDFCLKNDEELKTYILNINNKLDLRYDKDIYLDSYINNHYNDKKIDKDIDIFLNLILSKIKKMDKYLTELSNYVDTDYFNKINSVLINLLNSSNYSSIVNNLDIKLPLLPKNSEEEAKLYKDKINKLLKELKDICIYKDIEEIRESIYFTKDYVEVIIDIINRLDREINNYKKDNDIYEFIDISKLAIKVLEENSGVCEEIKNSFNEIMIDEYQDTNDLQEIFISKISKNNTYMVGDIKQSIYRFRNANPYIFKEKYDKYSKGLNGKKIDLTKNFRSREEVLSDINTIFDLIMDDDIGGANYKESHRMIFGNNTYINEGKTNQNNHLEIYRYIPSVLYKKEELEAFIIANDIKNKVNSKYQVFDKDKLVLRDIKYSDFSILIDRTTNFDLYKKIFNYLDIPLMKYTDTSITMEDDTLIIKNIIKLLTKLKDNSFDVEFKYAFLSIGRSYLFRLSDDLLFSIITNNNFKDNAIYNKLIELVSILDNSTIREILETIIDKFNFYENLIKVGSINDRINRLNYLLNLSNTLENLGYDINAFLNYLENIISNNYDINISYSTNSSDSVKIMTIHKSKGLEYHICYFPGMYNKFNISDLKEKITYDNTFGIITPFIKEDFSDTIYKTLMKNNYIKEEISEKIRLFYVALTRAKEKMIILTPLKDEEFNKEKLSFISFLDMLKSIRVNLEEYTKDVNLGDLEISKDYNIEKNINKIEDITTNDKKIIKRELNIKLEEKEKEKYSKDNNKLLTKEEIKKMDIGTKMHYILEGLDFNNPNIEALDIDHFYKEKLKEFFKLDLDFKNAKIYKEYEFNFQEEGKEKNGVIDLILEYDNEIKIIDYKLKNVKDEAYLKQLNGYKDYIENKTKKSVSIYLYSIIDGELIKL